MCPRHNESMALYIYSSMYPQSEMSRYIHGLWYPWPDMSTVGYVHGLKGPRPDVSMALYVHSIFNAQWYCSWDRHLNKVLYIRHFSTTNVNMTNNVTRTLLPSKWNKYRNKDRKLDKAKLNSRKKLKPRWRCYQTDELWTKHLHNKCMEQRAAGYDSLLRFSGICSYFLSEANKPSLPRIY